MKLTQYIATLFDRLLVVIGALLFMQIPLFIHQYEHQLIGHVDELKWQIQKMQSAASRTGKNLEQFIQKFLSDSDEDFSAQGEVMQATKVRWQTLAAALVELQQASTLTRPWVFLKTFQKDIFLTTAKVFEPGLPLTKEGAFYALVGIGFGALLSNFLRLGLKKARLLG